MSDRLLGGAGVSVNPVEPKWLRTKEASHVVRLSVRTLEKYRSAGIGPKFSKMGRCIVYAESDLSDWVRSKAKRSTSDPGIGTGRAANAGIRRRQKPAVRPKLAAVRPRPENGLKMSSRAMQGAGI